LAKTCFLAATRQDGHDDTWSQVAFNEYRFVERFRQNNESMLKISSTSTSPSTPPHHNFAISKAHFLLSPSPSGISNSLNTPVPKSYTTPCTVSLLSLTAAITSGFCLSTSTPCITFNSENLFHLSSHPNPSNSSACFSLNCRKGINHVSIFPTRSFPSAALQPPQPVCPQRTMCLTLRALTAYSITEVADKSVAVMTLAMLRCVKQVPGFAPKIVVSGWRESQQPNQRMGGACQVGNLERRSLSVSAKEAAQRLFASRKGAMGLLGSGDVRIQNRTVGKRTYPEEPLLCSARP